MKFLKRLFESKESKRLKELERMNKECLDFLKVADLNRKSLIEIGINHELRATK